MHITQFFDRGLALDPDRACLIGHDGEQLTYREVSDQAWRVARVLQSRGLRPGDAVAVVATNSVEVVLVILGVLRAGCRWVAVNARNGHDEIDSLIQLTDARALLSSGDLGLRPEQLGRSMSSDLVLSIDGDEGIWSWTRGTSAEPMPLTFAEEDVAILIGTGGTTGRSKAVQLTHRNLSTMVANYLWAMPPYDGAVNLVAAPITHGAGLMTWPQLAMGATTVIHRQVRAPDILAAIEKHRVSHLFLPPTAIYALLADPTLGDHDYSSLRYFLYGAAPMSVDKLTRALEAFGPVMVQTYGQVECPVTCAFLTPTDHLVAQAERPELLLSCGRPPLLTDLAILAEDGRPVGPGEQGEIAIRGDLVTPGYLGDPGATAEAQMDGWHLTGDLGYRDADGYLYINDRKKDMIISGGFNLYPSEIEQVIWGIHGVRDCAVIGIPDMKWGEALTAVVETEAGIELSTDDITGPCRERLGSMKTPKNVVFTEALPRSPVGKVLKRELRLEFWDGHKRLV